MCKMKEYKKGASALLKAIVERDPELAISYATALRGPDGLPDEFKRFTMILRGYEYGLGFDVVDLAHLIKDFGVKDVVNTIMAGVHKILRHGSHDVKSGAEHFFSHIFNGTAVLMILLQEQKERDEKLFEILGQLYDIANYLEDLFRLAQRRKEEYEKRRIETYLKELPGLMEKLFEAVYEYVKEDINEDV